MSKLIVMGARTIKLGSPKAALTNFSLFDKTIPSKNPSKLLVARKRKEHKKSKMTK